MKRFTLFFIALLTFSLSQAQVGVGTTMPDANSQLDVVSTTKGVFIPRLTDAEATTLATSLNASDDGLLIYNTTDKCIQFWDGAALQFFCVARVSGTGGGNAGVVKVNIIGAAAARDAIDIFHPSALVYTTANDKEFYPFGSTYIPPGNSGPTPGVNVVFANLNLSAPPTTNWPENTPLANRNLIQPTSAIWRDENVFEDNPNIPGNLTETADAWLENDISGQVTIWRITVLGNPTPSSGGEFECRLRNPESGFTTGYAQPIPAASGPYSQTFTLTTIADGLSLPSGTGDGYVLEFRSNSGSADIWVESITRISLYNE